MNDVRKSPATGQPSEPVTNGAGPAAQRDTGSGRRLLGLGVVSVFVVSLGFGGWRHYDQHQQVMATAEQHRTFVPVVRVGEVHASANKMLVTLPGTTLAFAEASIFARASGYIAKRYVDIGSRVKAGELLAEIVAPELDHQIALTEANLNQTVAALRQAEANRELARVTNVRTTRLVADGWVTKEQGDTDRLTYDAQKQAVNVAQANIAAQQAQLRVLQQQKAYQQVVAPFDGVVTQRNVDVGTLVQADNANGMPMFAMAHSDVIRVQLFVPQDSAFGVRPGVEAVVHVPVLSSVEFIVLF
jgi:RND family efflux transporter MFP subunit